MSTPCARPRLDDRRVVAELARGCRNFQPTSGAFSYCFPVFMLTAADVPDGVGALRALVLDQAHEFDTLKVFQAEVERLKAITGALQRRAVRDDRSRVIVREHVGSLKPGTAGSVPRASSPRRSAMRSLDGMASRAFSTMAASISTTTPLNGRSDPWR